MSNRFSTELRVSLADSLAFARLSGDYNPLHVDPIYARRTPFGDSVVHGIHLLLGSLEQIVGAGLLDGVIPVECSVTFNNPVRTASKIAIDASLDQDTQRLRLTGETQQRTALAATLRFASSSTTGNSTVVDRFEHPPATPTAAPFPPCPDAGDVQLRLGRAQLYELFPRLARCQAQDWITDLLASTQIVGMQCPGMNSIYSGFKLRQIESGSPVAGLMQYRVAKVNERFKLVRLHVRGSHFQGDLETLFRPPPVDQPSLSEISRSVPASCYEGHHALVVGGSRGLGELAAKAVLAGGGKVTITYARGRDDAQRICQEARTMQRDCSAQQLELAALQSGEPPDWLASGAFTHVYYFASPHIGRTADQQWNQDLFVRFSHAYVDAFATLVRAVSVAVPPGNPRARFLYPSSIFVERPEKGFAEYAAAKAAGEALCDDLARHYQTTILHPRFPRLRTDQTSALLETGIQDPLPIILAVVQQLHE